MPKKYADTNATRLEKTNKNKKKQFVFIGFVGFPLFS